MSKNAEGWIRHRGGKCPVDGGAFIDVRYRGGHIDSNINMEQFRWNHDGGSVDILAYRLHKPAEQVEPFIEAVHAFNALAKVPQLDGPIGWRDRITEIDSTTQALTTERAELVQKLASEGFALIWRINDLLTDAAQKHEDMSDWRNWKAGDLVECATGEYQDVYTQGCNYAVKEVKASAAMVYDDCGHGSACDLSDSHMDKFKWHSRPSA